MTHNYTNTNPENVGVFELLSELCTKTASKYSNQSRISQRRLTAKMRSNAYEIILKKSPIDYSTIKGEPIIDLLSYYLVYQQNVRNIAEYKRCVELKKIVSTLRQTDFGDNKENIYNVIRFLIGLKNTVKEDLSPEMFQNPFTFGLFEEMLPKPKREPFGSPQPYSYYPSYVFELPFSLKHQEAALDYQKSQSNFEYTVDSFDSRSYLSTPSQRQELTKLKTFLSPMSLPSMTSTHVSPYSQGSMYNYPRLTAPRDLQIPTSLSTDVNVKISLPSTNVKSVIKEQFSTTDDESMDIWELVTQIDKDIPDDIWDIVWKLPPIEERQLIASSSREVCLWRATFGDRLSKLDIITEKQFIRHIMYLTIGVETKSFPFNQESNCFYMKENLVLEGISQEHIKGYVSELLLVGTYYKRLYKFAFSETLEEQFHSNGLVYEAAREVVRRYLLEFRLAATEIYEKCFKAANEELNCMPTLLEILYHMEPLKYEIETVASIYKVINTDANATIPHGAELMSYLFNETSAITHKQTTFTVYNSLYTVCKVYFKFIERYIFEGELEDRYNEFFIRKDNQYVNCRSKTYWDKGFHITQVVAVPEFLKSVAKFILLCGKSLRLLKLCNPNDPLVLLISSDHPSVKCCVSFEDLERQQQVLDVYRTRCLFVSGELVTFDQILLKREAERKAFTEMASLKQAETMEKIVAERKRLAQLIIAEKQHSLRVLEAAMAEAKAAKCKAKQRERMRYELEHAAEKATEEVDSKLRNDERNKIMEYYSKLNMEVEKSKMHTEWKIKRLQLDQSRMQLLSTEERNLKREKLELEHQKNEEVMAMSIQSTDYNKSDEENNDKDDETNSNVVAKGNMSESVKTIIMEDVEEINSQPQSDTSSSIGQTSSTVISAICNVAKSFFGVSKSQDGQCDNNREVDEQGNIIRTKSEGFIQHTQSSSDIGSKLNEFNDNLQFQENKQVALLNKQKVMSHEFNQIDEENNPVKSTSLVHFAAVDEENNFHDHNLPFMEAKRNKRKVLGTEIDVMKSESKLVFQQPRTDAQKEALLNKLKVLGVEYNLPPENVIFREPLNNAQEEAVRNRKKMMSSDHEMKSFQGSSRSESAKRLGLTLNLKPYGEASAREGSPAMTPNAGSITPGDIFPRLDLETPTTAEIPLEEAMAADTFTPRSETSKDLESAKTREFLTTDGFNFPIMVDDENVESEITNTTQTGDTPDGTPSKTLETEIPNNTKYSFFNLLDGSYTLKDFDPFGIKDLKNFCKDHFTSKMNADMATSCYTHPSIIMEEVKKRPYENIFASQYVPEEDNEKKITCDNIATLTACLQKSVLLPLTYQLEVVNNSILTYFLVNLDMYEHLRSLKDYFFLMDGEFSRSICHNLFTKLVKTLNPQELLNFATLHNILDKALGSSISHVHKFSENLSFTITESPLSFQHSSPDVLQCLSLTYTVSWPLNIILSQEALLRYAKVFQFLVKMRRIFWVLGEDFEALKLSAKLSKQHSRKLVKSPQYISVQIYRHIMASMIRALDNYIVTTCILTSWTEFENDLKKARTLDDLYECHVVYIKKVLFRCLLNNRSTPVMKLLNDIFTVILKFSRVLKAGEWHQKEKNGAFTHTSFIQLQELFHLFEKLAKYLHKVVTKLMECGYQRHLVELLTMVNLNGYYNPEKTKAEHSSSVLSTT